MQTGPLFFFALPVAVMVLFEVWGHRSLSGDRVAELLAFVCLLPILAMLFECLSIFYGARKPDGFYYWTQGGSALLVLMAATTIKYLSFKN